MHAAHSERRSEASGYRLLRKMNVNYKQDPVTEGEIDMLLWALNNGRTEFAKVC